MKFILTKKVCDLTGPPEAEEWKIVKQFKTIHELFDYDCEAAAWFVNHPYCSYLEYDHGVGICWCYTRQGK